MYPSLKIEQGGNFQLGSISSRFLRIRLSLAAKFPAIVPTPSIDMEITSLVESRGKVP